MQSTALHSDFLLSNIVKIWNNPVTCIVIGYAPNTIHFTHLQTSINLEKALKNMQKGLHKCKKV